MKTNIEMAREADPKANTGEPYRIDPETGAWLERFAELVRADERAALIRYFNEHWRSDWSDGQIIEAIEARGNT